MAAFCAVARKRVSLVVRFWAKVKKGPRCWLWTASVDKDGYGQVGSGTTPPTMLKAHRVSWSLVRGAVPKGKNVLHRCDNPPCVRPSHLFLGTTRDNNHDMTCKGRNVFQKNNPSLKLSVSQVRAIRRRRLGGEKLRLIALAYGVTEGTVSRIAARVRRSGVV